MGKLTQLKQGSLNGLRRQTNECLDNAYNKGFEDGKKHAIDELPELANKENKIYNKALEDASELMAYITQEFIDNCYPNEKGYNLYDLNAKYGLARVLKDYKAYEEKKKAEEEEIKVGDEVKTESGHNGIVLRIYCFGSREWADVLYKDGSTGARTTEILSKTGRHFDEVEQLLDKLRGKE